MDTFRALGLSEKTISALEKKGFENPTEIQGLTIPLLLENKEDIIAQAQTGTGKTAAFALPIIEKIDPKAKGVQALILAPTRELVIQIHEEINSLKGDHGLRVAPIYGGQSISMQQRKLKDGLSIVAGTPGRILDHIRQENLRLDHLKYFILDEADEMLNMGFIDDIEAILDKTPDQKRVLLFSATMPSTIKKLAEKYLGQYTHVKAKKVLPKPLIDQVFYEVYRKNKLASLCRIIDFATDFYGIIFCRTKREVDELTSQLLQQGYATDALHGDVSQAQREKILKRFKSKQLSILIATDVAARGIDVNNLNYVVNYSLPETPETYIHRVGRTGRAGNKGCAITFVSPRETRKLQFIEKIAKVTLREETIPQDDAIQEAKRKQIEETLKSLLQSDKGAHYMDMAKEILKDSDPTSVVSSLLQHAFGKNLKARNYDKLITSSNFSDRNSDRRPRRKRNYSDNKRSRGYKRN